MKYLSLLAILFATTATTLSVVHPDQAVLGEAVEAKKYLIEVGQDDTRWITEDEKWVLRRVSQVDCSHQWLSLGVLIAEISAEGHQLHGHYRYPRSRCP